MRALAETDTASSSYEAAAEERLVSLPGKTGQANSGVQPPINLDALREDLERAITGEVRFDEGSRALYATDASNYRMPPLGVVIPKSLDDVVKTVEIARRHRAPILSRGGGTSLAGQCCNTAVVIDFTKYLHRVHSVDAQQKLGRVDPGCVLDTLRKQAEQFGLTFGPDPATHNHCTLGGMVGNNSCGVHAQMAGRTADNIEELDILTYDGLRLKVGRTSEEELAAIASQTDRRGEIYRRLRSLRDRYAAQIRERFPDIPRRVSGYNLDELLPEKGFHLARALVGSEGTCVVVLGITAQLVYSPPARSLLVLGFPDAETAGDFVPLVVEYKPIGCEGMDDRLLSYYRSKGMLLQDLTMMPPGGGWLLVEFGGKSKEESDAAAKALMERLSKERVPPAMKLYDDEEHEKKIWEVRESGLGATAFVPGHPDTWPGWEDSAVAPAKVGDYLRELRALLKKYDYDAALYGHYGQGCIHCRINFDLVTRHGIDTYREFVGEAAKLVVRFGGSLSGEHGDGQSRAELLGTMFGPELLEAFREFKSIWDPEGKMNPGKIVDPNPITSELRLGTDYRRTEVPAHFHYPDDKFSFHRAALRCVGVGECRRAEKGTMCPSYRVTGEEKHSTRGRARLLFEMLQGDVIKDGWKSNEVKEALDLCLACKGCKGDCPVNVDMATYKAEFLAHYYSGRLRPRHAYAFGYVDRVAHYASLFPRAVNFFTQAPGLRELAKAAAGIAPQRAIPKFAHESFRHWFLRRPARQDGGAGKVLLWTDTFNNYFMPETARAAMDVLHSAGFEVNIPRRQLCCGRPLYDFGMLDRAKRYLAGIMSDLEHEIREGTPIVVLEPSCAAVFRDELINMFPHNENAKRLCKQTYVLSQFLEERAPHFTLPHLNSSALLHGHCHQKALMKMDSTEAVLKKMQIDFSQPESGCCGMAGSFGFEKGEPYRVSSACGERGLLPAVRSSNKDTLLIADGFSCREQILQGSGRKALHLAEVIELGLKRERQKEG